MAAPYVIAMASLLGWLLYQQVLASPIAKGAAPIEVVKTTLTLMAALAAVLTGVYAYRKQRLSEGDAARADADQLTQRYGTAAEQLGHDKSAVRLAGVYAMARLADDWPNQRQQCIDVLCAYLRMPSDPDVGLSEREVRATIVRTISAHLREHSAVSWTGNDFDFTGAVLHGARFGGATFRAFVSFISATFSGEDTNFHGATFSGWSASFYGATFSGEFTDFGGATFGGNAVFAKAQFTGEFTIFENATFSGENTSFIGATFSARSVNFYGATFSGSNTTFERAIFSGAHTDFEGATYSGAHTDFERAEFSGATTADEATVKSSFVGEIVHWGRITPRPLPSPAALGRHHDDRHHDDDHGSEWTLLTSPIRGSCRFCGAYRVPA